MKGHWRMPVYKILCISMRRILFGRINVARTFPLLQYLSCMEFQMANSLEGTNVDTGKQLEKTSPKNKEDGSNSRRLATSKAVAGAARAGGSGGRAARNRAIARGEDLTRQFPKDNYVSWYGTFLTLTLTTRGIGFTEQNCVCFLKMLTFHRLFKELLNQYYRHVGTYLNGFFMVIPNMVMKFHNFAIFYKIC